MTKEDIIKILEKYSFDAYLTLFHSEKVIHNADFNKIAQEILKLKSINEMKYNLSSFNG